MSVPIRYECECCRNPAKYLIGHPPFACCGVHRNVVRRKLGMFTSTSSRTKIRKVLGFLFPEAKLEKEKP